MLYVWVTGSSLDVFKITGGVDRIVKLFDDKEAVIKQLSKKVH